jgi:hypothetical protein
MSADVAVVFRWLFLSGVIFLLISLVFLLVMEERPLRSSSSADPPAKPPES